jgi:hypothetical protein
MTGFTRIVIVLSLLRQAIGTQAAPPNQVIVGLSLFLTFFVMGPTIDRVHDQAYKPFAENKIAFDEALGLAVVADGERRVLQVAGWTGGEGDPPAPQGAENGLDAPGLGDPHEHAVPPSGPGAANGCTSPARRG